jgi:hypothetical protein
MIDVKSSTIIGTSICKDKPGIGVLICIMPSSMLYFDPHMNRVRLRFEFSLDLAKNKSISSLSSEVMKDI